VAVKRLRRAPRCSKTRHMAAEQPRVLDSIVDGLRFETLTLSRAEEAYALQAEAFADEPASAFTLADRAARLEECKRFSGMFTEECAGNGLSVACIEASTDKMVGALWIRDFRAPMHPSFEEILSKLTNLGKVIDVLVQVDGMYDALRPEVVGLGKAADLWMLAVHPDHRRKNIASKLTDIGLAHAHAAGFEVVVLESTGAFSARCAAKAGMHEIAGIDYADERQVHKELAGLQATPHTRLRIWESRREVAAK